MKGLRECAAIASDLAAKIYGMEVLDSNIEDDDINYTRFILLARQPVGALIPPGLKAKTTTLVRKFCCHAHTHFKGRRCLELKEWDFWIFIVPIFSLSLFE